MEIKAVEATSNRPQGNRTIDAPYVFVDLPSFIGQAKDEKAWKKNDRNGITVFKSDGITTVLTVLKETAVIKNNAVNGFLNIQVLEGKLRLETLEGDIEMGENQFIAFHPGMTLSLEASMLTVILITTYNINAEEGNIF